MDLTGRTALVTGGGSGIGRAIVAVMAGAGAEVGVVDLDGPAARAALREAGGRGVAVEADVTDEEAGLRAVRAVEAALGPVDVLVNNAGIPGVGPPKPAHETTREEWDRVLAVNLTGPFLLSRAVLPSMVRRGSGVIVNVASAAATVALPGRSPYGASKAGLLQLTRTLAVEYAESGIRVNAVCPGWVDTPMVRWRLERPETAQEVLRRVPMGRVARPEEVAAAVLFLASDAARYVTGHALVVDGGWTAA